MSDHSASLDRRDFLGRVALTGALLSFPSMAVAQPFRGSDDWDHRWLDGLTRKHRAFFDAKSWGGGEAFGYPMRYYDAMLDGYGAKAEEVQVVVGLHGTAWPLALDDAAWSRWQLGEVAAINDPATRARALRNVTRSDEAGEPFAQTSLVAWQKRGASILVCNNTLRRVSRELSAKQEGSTPDQLYTQLRAAVLPGVTVVPAMVAAIALAQAKGASYIVSGG